MTKLCLGWLFIHILRPYKYVYIMLCSNDIYIVIEMDPAVCLPKPYIKVGILVTCHDFSFVERKMSGIYTYY